MEYQNKGIFYLLVGGHQSQELQDMLGLWNRQIYGSLLCLIKTIQQEAHVTSDSSNINTLEEILSGAGSDVNKWNDF